MHSDLSPVFPGAERGFTEEEEPVPDDHCDVFLWKLGSQALDQTLCCCPMPGGCGSPCATPGSSVSSQIRGRI